MAKKFKMICDRCSEAMPQGNAIILEFLSQQHPGKNICPNCDSILYLAAKKQRDSINNKPPIKDDEEPPIKDDEEPPIKDDEEGKNPRSMRVQIKTGSEWHTTEHRGAMVTIDGQPIYQVLKASSQKWEEVGNKGKHGKWCIAEYELPVGAKIEFSATANGRDKITHSFVVGEIISVEHEGYSYYGNRTCGWIVSI